LAIVFPKEKIMKKLFAALLVSVILASTAHAYPGFGRWNKIASAYEEAYTEETFRDLQRRYPQPFEGMDPKKIVSATLTSVTYRYEGETACPANDPRLTYVSISISGCLKGADGYQGTCFASAVQMPNPRDPCAREE
jgi:hypothetical protein